MDSFSGWLQHLYKSCSLSSRTIFDSIYITKRGGQGRENEKVISVSGILYLNDTMVFTTPILFTF